MRKAKPYRRLILWAVMLALTLAACSRPSSGPEEVNDGALFTDSHIDQAVLELADSIEELSGTDEGEAPEGEELDLPAGEADMSTQAVLPGAGGLIAYVSHDPNSATPWQLWRANQVTDAKTQIFAGAREIQSVAVNAAGTSFVVTMRRTATHNDFEVYRLTLGSSTPARLTNTSTPERNVSMSADGNVIVWEGTNAGKRAIFIRVYSGTSFTDRILSATQNQIEPSVSADGNFIALVRQLSGKDRVMRYSRSANSYLAVFTISTGTARLRHPSPSNGGAKVAWQEVSASNQRVRVKTISSGATANVVSAANIEHPHLASDGNFLTYGLRQNNCWRVLTRNIVTAQVATGVSCTSPVNNLAPFWQLSTSQAGVWGQARWGQAVWGP